VEVNVIVRNQQGTAASLTRDDFQIFDRGERRSIASFEAHSPGEVRQPAAQLPPLVYVNQAGHDAGPRAPPRSCSTVSTPVSKTEPPRGANS